MTELKDRCQVRLKVAVVSRAVEIPGHAKHTALRAGQLTHTMDSAKWGREGTDWEHRLGGAQSQLLDAEKGLGDRRDTRPTADFCGGLKKFQAKVQVQEVILGFEPEPRGRENHNSL